MSTTIVSAFFFCTDPVRSEITRKVFEHYARVPDSTFIGVGSERDVSQRVLWDANPKAQYLEFWQDWPDVPPFGHEGLRRKYNTAVSAARDHDPEFVFCLGSDDLVPVEFFTPSDRLLVGNAQGEGSGAFFWPYGSERAFWWDGRSPFSERGKFSGGVLGFHRDLLDELDWQPFRFKGDELGIEKYVIETHGDGALDAREGMPAWHPKSGAVLNSMRLIRTHLELHDADPDTTKQFLDYWAGLGPIRERADMPIDPTRIPALEQELVYAKQVKAGGQLPDPGRVAAIEHELKIHRQVLEDQLAAQRPKKPPKEPKPNDTESKAKDRIAEAKAAAEAAKETTEAKAPEPQEKAV